MVAEFNIKLESGLTVNKTTAAKQQLDTAIVLLFRQHDYIPIHTLIGAATQILEDLCNAKGIKSESHEIFANYLVNGQLSKDAHQARTRHRNYFKHADAKYDDPETIKLPDPRLADALLYQGIMDYGRLGYESTAIMSRFYIWFLMQYPDSLDIQDTTVTQIIASTHSTIQHFPRSALLQLGLLMLPDELSDDEWQMTAKRLTSDTGTDIGAVLQHLYSCR